MNTLDFSIRSLVPIGRKVWRHESPYDPHRSGSRVSMHTDSTSELSKEDPMIRQFAFFTFLSNFLVLGARLAGYAQVASYTILYSWLWTSFSTKSLHRSGSCLTTDSGIVNEMSLNLHQLQRRKVSMGWHGVGVFVANKWPR